MHKLKPRTIMLIGVPASMIAFATPFVLRANSLRDLYAAALGGALFALFTGLPLFGAIAWAESWSPETLNEDPATLDRRYRRSERYFACAGMFAMGYILGWYVNYTALKPGEMPSQTPNGIGLALLLASMMVMMVVAIAKMVLVKRLELLKERNAAAKQPERNNSSAE